MYALYDYRYVIACSSLPLEFRREFRRLARGRVTSTYDRRTRAKDPMPAETQCRRAASPRSGGRRASGTCQPSCGGTLRACVATTG